MKKLTTAEEQVMQILWKLEKAFVKEIIAEFPEPKPAYNTVSTIIRILTNKEFVGYKAYGKTHEYFPKIKKEIYSESYLKNFIGGYFGGSFEQMVSFFVKKNDINVEEFEILMKQMKNKNDDNN